MIAAAIVAVLVVLGWHALADDFDPISIGWKLALIALAFLFAKDLITWFFRVLNRMTGTGKET